MPRAAAALAGTVVLWACAFPAIRVGLDGYGVAALSLLRLVVATVVLVPVARAARVRRPRRRDLPLIVLCGASGMSAYQLLLNWGEVHVPAGTASLLIAVAPAFSVLVAAAFLGERLTAGRVFGSAIAVAGSAVIAFGGGSARYTTGAWIVLAAAVAQGIYHTASKPLLRNYRALEVACYAMWSGAIFLLPFSPALIRAVPRAPTEATISAILLGVLPSALGFVIWGYAVARMTIAAATAALYLVPPVAVLVAFGWLGESPHWVELVGGCISIAGVVLINRSSNNHALTRGRPSRLGYRNSTTTSARPGCSAASSNSPYGSDPCDHLSEGRRSIDRSDVLD
jgi:drug/metabolite transporter (DMT)-like permease